MASETIAELRQALPYRDCVGIALFNRRGQVFIGRRLMGGDSERAPEHGAPWQMPQGGIDAGEDQLEAAHRELLEETNVTSIRLLAEAPGWIYYDLPDEALGKALKGKYRGQRQRWFAFLFTGDENEIDVVSPGGGKFHAEFDDWRWEELTNTPDLIVAFKREAYLQVVKAFADIPSSSAMPEIVLRRLSRPDRKAWANLRHALWPHHSADELFVELDDMTGETFENIGAFKGAELIGFAEAEIRPWGDGCETAPVAWLEGIYVVPTWRRQGIGRRLVEAVADWGRGQGMSELGSDAYLDNLQSRLSHAIWGFEETKRVVMFRRKLT